MTIFNYEIKCYWMFNLQFCHSCKIGHNSEIKIYKTFIDHWAAFASGACGNSVQIWPQQVYVWLVGFTNKGRGSIEFMFPTLSTAFSTFPSELSVLNLSQLILAFLLLKTMPKNLYNQHKTQNHYHLTML